MGPGPTLPITFPLVGGRGRQVRCSITPFPTTPHSSQPPRIPDPLPPHTSELCLPLLDGFVTIFLLIVCMFARSPIIRTNPLIYYFCRFFYNKL